MQPRYRWIIPDWREADRRALPVDDQLLAAVLLNRGLKSAEDLRRFLDPDWDGPPSPFDLPGIHEATARLRWAAGRGQRVIVHGDYDVDGLTATALMLEVLEGLGAEAIPYIPNRFETGYGLDLSTVPQLASQGEVLVTVDCGIRAAEEVDLAKRLGMQVIITDHHLPAEELPRADAVVSSRLPGGERFGELAGVGVAYVLAMALEATARRFGAPTVPDQHRYLDLVALGTIADVASLGGENRRLTRLGLEMLSRAPSAGIAALARSAGMSAGQVTSEEVAFRLAPRLNSAGRLGSSLPALELLRTADPNQAASLALSLERTNRQRQDQVKQALAWSAAEVARQADDEPILFIADERCHPGIVGLIAGRISEQFGLPAGAAHLDGDLAHGSLRSSDGFNAGAALDACAPLLLKHGGHSQAAGFTCRISDLEAVRDSLRASASQALERREGGPILEADAETGLIGPEHSLWDSLPMLEPTGRGNSRPLFVSRGVSLLQKETMGREGEHLRLLLGDASEVVKAVGFRMGGLHSTLPDRLDIAYELEEHFFNGNRERRLLLRDLSEATT